MAVQGVYYPVSAFTVYNAATNPSRITAKDGSYASYNQGLDSNGLMGLVGYNYASFNIPADATIDGIEIVVNAYMSGVGSAVDYEAQLRKNGVTVAANRAAGTAVAGTDTEYVYGGSSDLWGTTWVPDDIHNDTFGAFVSWNVTALASSVDLYIDSIGVRVYYTVPPVNLLLLRNHRMNQGMV